MMNTTFESTMGGFVSSSTTWLLENPIASLSLCIVAFVYLSHVVHRIATRHDKIPTHTLTLRRLKVGGAELLQGQETSSAFLDEYDLLSDLLFPKLDFCVMKSIDRNIPLLAKQEQLHAKMHNEAQKERKRLEQPGLWRWSWYISLADVFLLRLGRHVGSTLAGFAEASSSVWFYIPMILSPTKNYMNNECAYHALEELEHGILTTQFLRHQVSPLSPLFAFPLVVVFFAIYFFGPPIMVLLVQPSLLLKPKSYKDFLAYHASIIPVFLGTLYAFIAYWILPYNEDPIENKKRYQFFQDLVRDRGIEFEIVCQETYQVERDGTVSIIPEAGKGDVTKE